MDKRKEDRAEGEPEIRGEVMLLVLAVVRQAVHDAERASDLSIKEDAALFMGNCRYKWCEEILIRCGLTKAQIVTLRDPNVPWLDRRHSYKIRKRGKRNRPAHTPDP